IGITSAQRSPFFPDLPTLDEQGVKGFNAVAWSGLFALKGTPPEIVERIHAETVKALNSANVKARLRDLAMVPIADSQADFDAFVRNEMKRWGEAVKASGAKVD